MRAQEREVSPRALRCETGTDLINLIHQLLIGCGGGGGACHHILLEGSHQGIEGTAPLYEHAIACCTSQDHLLLCDRNSAHVSKILRLNTSGSDGTVDICKGMHMHTCSTKHVAIDEQPGTYLLPIADLQHVLIG